MGNSPSENNLKKTPLYPFHKNFGAKMAPFAGWEMPLWYTTPTEEHQAVRTKAGKFDVSHMGVFEVERGDLDWLTPTLLSEKQVGSVTYTFLMHPGGGVVDDVLVFKWSDTKFWIISNGVNRKKVSELLSVQPLPLAIIALQGPAVEMPEKMSFSQNKKGWVVSGTGYTGEKGVEIFLPEEEALAYFESLDATPCGLAARDTLRLEKGFALYGHELSETIAPEESVSAWVIKKRGTPYLGQGKRPIRRHAIAFIVEEGIAREGAVLLSDMKEVGVVTSGSFSPTLKKGIALALVTETPTHVMMRGKKVPIFIQPKFAFV